MSSVVRRQLTLRIFNCIMKHELMLIDVQQLSIAACIFISLAIVGYDVLKIV